MPRPSIAMPPQAQTGYPVSISGGCFRDKNNNPCFALAEDAAELMTQLSLADVEVYLADRSARGVNYIWSQCLENILGTSPPNDFDGNAPFTGGVDFVNPNPVYWARVLYIVRRCKAWNIGLALNVFFFGLSNAQGYRNSVMTSSDAVLQTFADFIATTFGNEDNVTFLIGGDLDPNNATGMAKTNVYATRLKAGAPNRLMTMEASRFKEAGNGGGLAPNGGYSTYDAWILANGSVPTWVDFNSVYLTQATTLSGSQRCLGQGGLLCFYIEGGYELEVSNGVTMTAALLRGQEFYSVLAACVLGHMFGNGAIWSFNASGTQSGFPWKGQLASAGSRHFQFFGKLLRSLRFHLLVPDASNVTMTASTNGVCARDSEGKAFVAYTPSAGFTFDMTKITDASGLANAFWVDPTNGVAQSAGAGLSTSGSRTFTPPGNNAAGDSDWALVVIGASAGFRTPGT